MVDLQLANCDRLKSLQTFRSLVPSPRVGPIWHNAQVRERTGVQQPLFRFYQPFGTMFLYINHRPTAQLRFGAIVPYNDGDQSPVLLSVSAMT